MTGKIEKRSASAEDYLEIIYRYSKSEKSFKSVDIAKELNISRASVSEAIKKLADQGFLTYEKYKPITLTEKGLKIAEKVYEKHCTLCLFFEKYLGLTNDEAQENACHIEHVITENAFKKIADLCKDL